MAGDVDRVRAYYDRRGESEWHRLAIPFEGAVEREINGRALEALLPPASRVLDLGGGPGRWAVWLARRGHRVVLADLSPVQLAIARREIEAAGPEVAAGVEAVLEVDARDLSRFADGSFDAVLALGPFYHLTAAADRERAAAEVRRVLRAGGRLFASVMARYPWALGLLLEQGAAALDAARTLLETGVYRRVAGEGFDEGFLFRPGEVTGFFEEQGFRTLGLLASQGFLGLVQEPLAALRERDEAAHAALLDLAWEACRDPAIHGLSPYLLYSGQAP